MTDEIECRDCDGEGRIWNNADPTSNQFFDCEVCCGHNAKKDRGIVLLREASPVQ